uniref:MAK10-like protein n=1 Tax=Tanacetum cinerariifolium TaxID=118510 RepID=A0A6L2KFX5_TANCI|nr:MAK10-like protein [Tanacetum cinerariifolium]GEV59209.1 MAK10-like protein [Tanacetum cinerariifolium]
MGNMWCLSDPTLSEDLALYDNESWNDPRDFDKPVKAISLPQDVLSTSDFRLIELENQVQRLMKAYLTPNPPVQVNKIASSCEIYSGPRNTQYCMKNPEQAFVDYASSCIEKAGGKWFTFKPEQNNLGDTYNPSWKSHLNLRWRLRDSKPFDTLAGLADGTKSYPIGIVKNVEVHIGKLRLKEDFYAIALEKDHTCPSLVRRGFLATVSVVIDAKKAKIAIGEGVTSTNGIGARPPYYAKKDFMDYHLPEEWEIARGAKLNPFKDILVFRKMVDFLGTIPINLKGNMWESKELIENKMDWNGPPKEGDDVWHIRIKLIDPDRERFNRAFQSIPITRKLFTK